MKRFFFLLLFLSLVISSFGGEKGKSLPDYRLKNTDGKFVKISEIIKDKVALINFWATWCSPCAKEMKSFKKLYKKFKGEDFIIVSISIDDSKTQNKVKPYIRSRKIPFVVLQDPNRDYFKMCHFANVPSTILVDKNGKMVFTHTGYRPGDEKKLETKIKMLLGK